MIKNLCGTIKNKFNNLNSNYGDYLYNKVSNITNNFSINLSFNELKNKLPENDLDYLVSEYCKNNKNTFIIIVWPVTYNPDPIIHKNYNKYGNILYKKEIKFTKNGFSNSLHFISDKKTHTLGKQLWFAEPHSKINPLTIYVFETKSINVPKNEMINYLTKIFNNNHNHILNIDKKGGLNNLYITTKCKRECRDEFNRNGNIKKVLNEKPPFQYSHHVNDEHHETIELCNSFLNNNSIFAIDNAVLHNCPSFNDKYKRYYKFVLNNKFGNVNDFCIDNSSVLSQFAIRHSRDIDYLHNEKFNIPKQIPEEEISSHNFVIKPLKLNISIDDIVYNPNNHFWLHNIKFMSLNVLKQVKTTQQNDKAKNDLVLINKFLTNK